ncbi:hypothetical protein [Streptomyces californicus]|uniref:hypothetical protein n=1 Tax=Streptomyces californicus TaxID=67351 RepID=UPI00332DE3D9
MPSSISTSHTVAERIETLYGQPLAVLEAHDHAQAAGSMLAALVHAHSALQLAERSIDFHRDRLRSVIAPDRRIESFDAGHILDCARRVAEAVATRDAYATTVNAVLDGLHRTPAADTTPSAPAVPPPPAPAPSATR